MIDPTFRNINRLFVLSLMTGENDPRNSFDQNCMPLVEIKYFNASIDNKPVFMQTTKTNKKHMKNLLKWSQTMAIQKETY